jgi:hypothetical protein
VDIPGFHLFWIYHNLHISTSCDSRVHPEMTNHPAKKLKKAEPFPNLMQPGNLGSLFDHFRHMLRFHNLFPHGNDAMTP